MAKKGDHDGTLGTHGGRREQRSMGAEDHVMEAMQIIDTNITDTGVNPYDSGDVNRDRRDGE